MTMVMKRRLRLSAVPNEGSRCCDWCTVHRSRPLHLQAKRAWLHGLMTKMKALLRTGRICWMLLQIPVSRMDRRRNRTWYGVGSSRALVWECLRGVRFSSESVLNAYRGSNYSIVQPSCNSRPRQRRARAERVPKSKQHEHAQDARRDRHRESHWQLPGCNAGSQTFEEDKAETSCFVAPRKCQRLDVIWHCSTN